MVKNKKFQDGNNLNAGNGFGKQELIELPANYQLLVCMKYKKII